MPPLIRRDTPLGPRYFLDRVSMENGDLVEIWIMGASEACHRGYFFWSGIPDDEPFVWNAGYGCRVSPDRDFRRYVPERVEYVQPPMSPEVKDHERRARYKPT